MRHINYRFWRWKTRNFYHHYYSCGHFIALLKVANLPRGFGSGDGKAFHINSQVGSGIIVPNPYPDPGPNPTLGQFRGQELDRTKSFRIQNPAHNDMKSWLFSLKGWRLMNFVCRIMNYFQKKKELIKTAIARFFSQLWVIKNLCLAGSVSLNSMDPD